MNSFVNYLYYLAKEVYKFITYYPCTLFSRFIDYFHYKTLVFFQYPIFTFNPASGIIGNKCYGNLWAVKNATGKNFHSNCMIEHGLYFGEFVLEDECTLKEIDTIYTYSEYRKKAILKWFDGNIDKEIIPIGPYIQYADNFKSLKQLNALKEKLGKVLLVFPSHSSPGANVDYNEEQFIKEVESQALSFDTVLVSLFWLDVRRGLDKSYLKRGYKVVCSGMRSDRWFLSRQKDLFFLADFSMSNDIGTHIGYSVAMGVPHYLFKQKVNISGGVEFSTDKFNQIREREYNEMIDAFGKSEQCITTKQKELVKHFWGAFDLT